MKAHIFIDRTWLFKACGARKALASKTETSNMQYSLNFDKLNGVIIDTGTVLLS